MRILRLKQFHWFSITVIYYFNAAYIWPAQCTWQNYTLWTWFWIL